MAAQGEKTVEKDGGANESRRVEMLYCRPGYQPPHPNAIMNPANAAIKGTGGGVKLVRISPTLVARFGTRVSLTEARTHLFLEERAPAMPVPRVHAFFTWGPIPRNIDEYGSLYDNFMIMDFIEGSNLEDSWDGLGKNEKDVIMEELGRHIRLLRSIKPEDRLFIGSVDRSKVNDNMFDSCPTKGPFSTEQEFHAVLIKEYTRIMKNPHMQPCLEELLSQRPHSVVFTHADLRPANIMAKDGNITGIVDWEMSGWYPDYWEHAKAFWLFRWKNDWGTRLLRILEPFHVETLTHRLLAEVLW